MPLPLPLIRLSIGLTNGTAHWGAVKDGVPFTLCATHSPDLVPIAPNTAHQMCQSCRRGRLALSSTPHPGTGEPDARPAAGTGKGAVGHRPIPGHLLGYCGKPLDARRSSSRKVCANCLRLSDSLAAFQRRVGPLLLPPDEPCHGGPDLLWAPRGRANLVTGHRRDAATGRALCGQHLAGPNPGAQECAPCRRRREENETARQMSTLPAMRKAASGWDQRPLDVYEDRAGALRPGDAYTRPDCADRHHVATVAERGRGSHTDLLVYLPGEDRLTEVRIRRDRLVTVQRPLTTTE